MAARSRRCRAASSRCRPRTWPSGWLRTSRRSTCWRSRSEAGPAKAGGIHIKEELLLVAAVGIDAEGTKHPLGVFEGTTENAATAQALPDNLIGRGLDPAICRLFIVDGAKALTKAIRRTFGSH